MSEKRTLQCALCGSGGGMAGTAAASTASRNRLRIGWRRFFTFRRRGAVLPAGFGAVFTGAAAAAPRTRIPSTLT